MEQRRISRAASAQESCLGLTFTVSFSLQHRHVAILMNSKRVRTPLGWSGQTGQTVSGPYIEPPMPGRLGFSSVTYTASVWPANEDHVT